MANITPTGNPKVIARQPLLWQTMKKLTFTLVSGTIYQLVESSLPSWLVVGDTIHYMLANNGGWATTTLATSGTTTITFDCGTNTPDIAANAQESIYITRNAWLTADEFLSFPNGLGISTTDTIYTSGTLDKILAGVCGEINKRCDRYFNLQTVDEMRNYVKIQSDRECTVHMDNSPIVSINSLNLNVLNFFVPLNLNYVMNAVEESYLQFAPFLVGGIGINAPAAILSYTEARIWINYTAGYTSETIPYDIKEATALLAMKRIAAQKNPMGASLIKTQTMTVGYKQGKDNTDPIEEQITSILKGYKKADFAVA